MKRKINSMDMCSGPLFSNILNFFIPLFLTGLLQRMYHAADTIVVGRYAGKLALAAVGASGSLSGLLLDFFLGLSTGVSVVLGRSIGAKDDETAEKTVHTAISVSLLGGLFVSLVGIIFARPLLSLIDVPEDVMPQAKIYMQIMFAGKIPALVYNFGASILRSKGDTKRPMYIITVSGIMNVCLNLLLVVGFKMQADGVALATVISQIYTAVAVIRILCHDEGVTKLSLKKMKIYKNIWAEIIKVGIPVGLQSAAYSFANVIVQTCINSFGSAVIAGNTAGASISGLYYIGFNCFMQTSIAFVSQNMGAKKYDRIEKIIKYCIIDVLLLWIIIILITIFAGKFLLKIYIPSDGESLTAGLTRLYILGYTYGLCGLTNTFGGTLRSMGYSFSVMLITIIGGTAIKIAWILTIFSVFRNLVMLYLSFGVSWLVSLIILIILYRYAKRKLLQTT